MDEFDWPCYRRDAHGPHEVDEDDETVGLDMVLGDDEPYHCPGVKAHPNTMIGRWPCLTG